MSYELDNLISKLCSGCFCIAGSLLVLLGSTSITIGCWGLNKQVPPLVKTIGGLLVLNGLILESERQIDLELEQEFINQQEKMSKCDSCRFYSGVDSLLCAVNPYEVNTAASLNCKDFELK